MENERYPKKMFVAGKTTWKMTWRDILPNMTS
jgi:hypothetical protein